MKDFIADTIYILAVSALLIGGFFYATSEEVWNAGQPTVQSK